MHNVISGYMCDFILAPETQQVKFHSIAGTQDEAICAFIFWFAHLKVAQQDQ